MKIWIKAFAAGLVSAAIWYASLFIPALRPDPFGLALAPIAIGVALLALGCVLTMGWACERWLIRGKTISAISVALLVGVVIAASLARFLEERWGGDGFMFFGIHATAITGPAVLFVVISALRRKKPIQPSQTTSGSCAPTRV